MEIEKNLFKLTEKVLLSRKTRPVLTFLFSFSVGLMVISSITFILGVYKYQAGNGALQHCIESINNSQQFFKKDDITQIVIRDFEELKQYPSNEFLRYNNSNSSCLIYQNVETNYTQLLLFSKTFSLLQLHESTRTSNHFDNYTIILDQPSLFKFQKYLFGKYELVMNELIESEFFKFEKIHIQLYQDNYYFLKKIFTIQNKIILLLKSFFGSIILSTISLLYIYGTIVSAPAFLIFLIELFNLNSNISKLTIYKVFPWIGLYMHVLDNRQNQLELLQSRTSSKYISRASVYNFFLIYFLYFGIMLGLADLLFLKPIKTTMNENYYGFIALVEFCSLLFLRTRTSIKYFPCSFLILQLSFLFYAGSVNFGYKNWFFTLDLAITFLIFTIFLIKIEIPSQTTWNKGMNYTPIQHRPRSLYMASYNLMWMNDIPDYWTLCVPMTTRNNFSRDQLSFVDEDFQLLQNNMQSQE